MANLMFGDAREAHAYTGGDTILQTGLRIVVSPSWRGAQDTDDRFRVAFKQTNVVLFPITSRGTVSTRTAVAVPCQDLPALIRALQQAHADYQAALAAGSRG